MCDVRNNDLAVSQSDAVNLAALYIQAIHGNDANVAEDDCRAVLPSSLWQTRKASDWMAAIAKAYNDVRDTSTADAKALFVARVRRANKLYGVTFFGAARQNNVKKKHAAVHVGVGADGVVVVRANAPEAQENEIP